MKRILSTTLCLCASTAFVLAQNGIVTGKVLDEMGEPIIGATIQVVGSTDGTITNTDGEFSISAPQKASLQISYIGFISQNIKAFSGQTVVLKEDNQQLEEVVVVGYGTQKKAHLTGSVATVQLNEIEDLSSGGLSTMLSGMVNGVSVSGGDARPGENASITIRETNSLKDVGVTAQEPLYVIDGYIYPNDVTVGNTSENLGATAFNNLDPSVIESISVLKDAAAAVYGSRAANGVILVTTKRGQIGKPKISYSGSVGLTDEVYRPKMLSAYQYGQVFNAIKAADPTSTTLNNRTDLFQYDELQAMKSLNYDLLDKYWETGVTQKHSITLSGGSEAVSYFAGISYFNQDGNLGKLDYDRWTYRAGIDVKITKYLKANLSINGDNSEKNKPLVKVGGTSDEKDYNLLLTHLPYIPEYVNGYAVGAYGVSNNQETTNQNYSFSELRNNGDYSNSMTGNFTVSGSMDLDFSFWEPLKGLTARINYSKSINTSKDNQYGTDYTVYQMVNRFGSAEHLYTPTGSDLYTTDYLYSVDNMKEVAVSNGSPSFLSRATNRTDNYQLNFTLNYGRDFGDHHVGALFSIERSEAENEYLYGMVSDPYPFTTGQSNSAEGNTKTTTFKRGESGSMSYIGRANYAYNNKYLFEFLLRSDASTKFAPENMWGFFPAMSGGWVMSQESWLNDNEWVDFLKLRASWGLTGRDNTAAWQWMQVYAQDANRGPVFGEGILNESSNRITINKNNSAVNRDVTWDKSYKTNFGIDFNTLANRLAFNVDYYFIHNREMLLNLTRSVSTVIGTQTAALNIGETNNYGVEVGIRWADKIGTDWKYKVSVNTGYSDNKVLNMDWETENLYRQITKNHRSDVGLWGMQCIGMFRSFQDIEEYFDRYGITSYMGMTKDKVRPGMLIYKDVRGAQQTDGSAAGPDGIVDADDDQVCLSNRSSNPYGFTTNFSVTWKDLSVTGQFSASWGSYTTIPGAALKTGDGIETANLPSFWKVEDMYSYQDVYDASGNLVVKENRDAKYPNLAYSSVNAVTSSFWRVKNNSVRLSRVTLAYRVPAKWLKRYNIDGLRFNVTGQNLLEFCNDYPDEFMSKMTTYGSYPTLRKWTIGMNLTF
ncbi:MAG: TonB-dependent receptor [Bacteroidales bacterium]|nr:TonB-dependent receptor [Bacteroidales bacterium]